MTDSPETTPVKTPEQIAIDLQYVGALNRIGATISVAKTQIIELLMDVLEQRVDLEHEQDQTILEKVAGVAHLIKMSDEFAKKSLTDLNAKITNVSPEFKIDVDKLQPAKLKTDEPVKE